MGIRPRTANKQQSKAKKTGSFAINGLMLLWPALVTALTLACSVADDEVVVVMFIDTAIDLVVIMLIETAVDAAVVMLIGPAVDVAVVMFIDTAVDVVVVIVIDTVVDVVAVIVINTVVDVVVFAPAESRNRRMRSKFF
eukprot:TRINITY_DN12506_c0_g1_i1.p3 TRINITY_DN12506_c0_g1~~TRINITY_DN12506_c0_g1_i1.p3  ORF type:complete len:139 (-),score=28.29 TRINITY_DN12506_c0_g1_i1:515-931(-)